jgi:hypothetical protein
LVERLIRVPEGVIFVAADEPVLVFASVGEAECSLEPIDVEDGVYPAAYGRTGEPFSVTSDGRVVAIKRAGEPNKPDELRALLLRYIEATGQRADPSHTLDELVAMVWALQCKGQRQVNVRVWGCLTLVGMIAAIGIYLVVR